MKVQFVTGSATLELIDGLGIDGLSNEDGLATVTILSEDPLERQTEVGKLVMALGTTAHACSQVGDPNEAVIRRLLEDATSAIATASNINPPAGVSIEDVTVIVGSNDDTVGNDEATTPDTGSHSLPTGDETTSNASQDNSDATTTEEYQDDGKQAKRSRKG